MFRRHLQAFLLVNALLAAINIYTGPPWWTFWPLLVWGFVLLLHFLFHRARAVDEAWVEERTQEVRSRSYDVSHMDEIREHPAPSIADEKREKR